MDCISQKAATGTIPYTGPPDVIYAPSGWDVTVIVTPGVEQPTMVETRTSATSLSSIGSSSCYASTSTVNGAAQQQRSLNPRNVNRTPATLPCCDPIY